MSVIAIYRHLLSPILITEPNLINYSEEHVAENRNPCCPRYGHAVDKPRATVKYIETQTEKEKDVCN